MIWRKRSLSAAHNHVIAHSVRICVFHAKSFHQKFANKSHKTIDFSMIRRMYDCSSKKIMNFIVLSLFALDIAPFTNIDPRTLTNWNYMKATPFWCWKNAMMDGSLAHHSERATLAHFPATMSNASNI